MLATTLKISDCLPPLGKEELRQCAIEYMEKQLIAHFGPSAEPDGNRKNGAASIVEAFERSWGDYYFQRFEKWYLSRGIAARKPINPN
jgi:hypothetical protein